MVFEARAGETFLLGASTWRIEQITHDRVLVSPAPGEPGKMPFWKGEGPGRPIELGQAIGKLTRELRHAPPADAVSPADQRSRPEPAGGREPAAVPRRPAAGDRRRARRSHHPDRALDRRHRRLAALGADAVRQPRPRAVGDGGHGAGARRARPRRRGDVERRRLRGARARRRRAARSGAARAGPGRRRAAGRAPAGFHGDVRGALPRGRRPGAAAAQAPSRRARAAVAAAQARRRSAGGGGAVRLVPDHPRGLPRVPARRVRPAGAGRAADQGAQPDGPRAHRGRAEVVAVRRVAALRLRRQLPLRRRCAAGGAAGARAVGRSGAAAPS